MRQSDGHFVSVVLCTHNGRRFVAEQVSSILNQTRVPNEIVLSDDDSTDGTVELVEKMVREFSGRHSESGPALKLIRNSPALGIRRNFEQALTKSQGDVILLCDQDDRWYPVKIEAMLEVFSGRPELLLLHGDAALIDEGGAQLGSTLSNRQNLTSEDVIKLQDNRGLDVLVRRNVVTGATVMLRSSLVQIAGSIPKSWLHDEWLAVVAAALGGLSFEATPFGEYRQHSSNQVGVRRRPTLEKVRMVLAPREPRNTRMLNRAVVLQDRIRSIGAPPAALRVANEKLEHEQVRAALAAKRILRVLPVLREYRTGRYDLFGRGRRDLLRDLLQSPRQTKSTI